MIVDKLLKEGIVFHDALHGFSLSRDCGMAVIEAAQLSLKPDYLNNLPS